MPGVQAGERILERRVQGIRGLGPFHPHPREQVGCKVHGHAQRELGTRSVEASDKAGDDLCLQRRRGDQRQGLQQRLPGDRGLGVIDQAVPEFEAERGWQARQQLRNALAHVGRRIIGEAAKRSRVVRTDRERRHQRLRQAAPKEHPVVIPRAGQALFGDELQLFRCKACQRLQRLALQPDRLPRIKHRAIDELHRRARELQAGNFPLAIGAPERCTQAGERTLADARVARESEQRGKRGLEVERGPHRTARNGGVMGTEVVRQWTQTVQAEMDAPLDARTLAVITLRNRIDVEPTRERCTITTQLAPARPKRGEEFEHQCVADRDGVGQVEPLLVHPERLRELGMAGSKRYQLLAQVAREFELLPDLRVVFAGRQPRAGPGAEFPRDGVALVHIELAPHRQGAAVEQGGDAGGAGHGGVSGASRRAARSVSVTPRRNNSDGAKSTRPRPSWSNHSTVMPPYAWRVPAS